MSDHRDEIVDYLRRQLIGPLNGDDEVLNESPTYRYLAGILFPKGASVDFAMVGDLEEDRGDDGAGHGQEDPIALAHQQMPSSAALSFLLANGDSIVVKAGAGVYEKNASEAEAAGGSTTWRRRGLSEQVELTPDSTRRTVLEGRAEVVSVWRQTEVGFLVTVAIVNLSSAKQRSEEDALCQVSLSCTPTSGSVAGYPTSGSWFRDSEDEEQALLHRTRPAYTIGHGASASWNDESPRTLSLTYMPEETVHDVDFNLEEFDEVLQLNTLARISTDTDVVVDRLYGFVTAYDRWIESTSKQEVPPSLEGARDRLLDRLRRALSRMQRGVSILESDAEAREIFGLANRAMVMQMTHSRDFAERQRKGTFRFNAPDYDAQRYGWRPFQLAFLLLNLEAVLDETSPERDLVDLIWFPTGGGKTEAYLGLVAMTVLLRRRRLGDGGAGTAVITRYTLRLLTSQQFQRAAALICALEYLRREDQHSGRYGLGSRPISTGLWVGGGSSPNKYSDAEELYDALLRNEEDGSVSFQVELCPWCGTEVVPEDHRTRENVGIEVSNEAFRMFCPNGTCPFHDSLPLSSVDDDLYANPPTLLIATVDKFARLAWEPRSGVFLGSGDDPGPDLIIQDELHLISGPLGTIMGLYEAAFDLVMRMNGSKPKLVASTATIRNAERHVRGLFNRDVFLFPPSGLTAEDSYFVKLDPKSPGRRYVGLMAQAHSPVTANVRVAAGLLQAPMELELDEAALDHMWTLVAYHNSLRELGRTVTLTRDDIPSWISVTAHTGELERDLDAGEGVIEITSNIPAAAIPRELEKLQRRQGVGAVSLAACTNMISVGVDVQRLGLMLVVGQPKTTSEYIQATSRVGRSRDNPGLVVTLLSAAKSRDRSHFETFRSFHGAMYRSVEPTSVTPFALPARRRALHAALVILMRHALGLSPNGAAQQFDGEDSAVKAILADLLDRVDSVEELERDDTAVHLKRLVEQWEDLTRDPAPLYYYSMAKQVPSLLRRFGQEGGLWPTLDSMRNVDTETLIKVRGEK